MLCQGKCYEESGRPFRRNPCRLSAGPSCTLQRLASPATNAPLQFLIGGATSATEASRRPRVGCLTKANIKRSAVPSGAALLCVQLVAHYRLTFG
jgi:hypothetical protein